MTSQVWQVLVLLLLALVVLEGVILVGLMRQVGGLLLRLPPARPGATDDGPEAGTIIPAQDLPRKAGILMFLSPGCAFCEDLLPGLPSVARHYPDLQLLAVPVADSEQEREAYSKSLPIEARSDLHELRRTLNIIGTPYAVGFDEEHRVAGSGAVNNIDQLETLALAALHGYHEADGDGQVLGDGHEASDVELLKLVESESSAGRGVELDGEQ